MIVELLGEKTLEVILTPSDLMLYNLSFKELDYKNINTKKVLRDILKMVENQTDFCNIPHKCMAVQALSSPDGSILMIISLFDKTKLRYSKEYRIKQTYEPELFMFSNSEDLIRAVIGIRLIDQKWIKNSEIYYTDNKYILILHLNGKHSYLITYILNEFSDSSSKGLVEVAKAIENGKQIVSDKALNVIYKYFG
jgi:negative regulator of genetic competence, sporulation and motility